MGEVRAPEARREVVRRASLTIVGIRTVALAKSSRVCR
jgi:hypothetical protein